MSWLINFIQGSYNGIPFYTTRAGRSGGRKLVEHLFPKIDDSKIEDMGRTNKRFTFSCYVLGNNYFQIRDDLEAELDKGGPGVLTHPYKGDIDVRVDTFSIEENNREGRIARFTINFIREKEEALVVYKVDPFEGLVEKKKNFLEKILAAFEKAYDVASKPLAVLDDAIDVANQINDVMLGAKKLTGIVDEFQAKVDALKGKLEVGPAVLRSIAEDFQQLFDFGVDLKDAANKTLLTPENAKKQYDELKNLIALKDETLSKFPEQFLVDPLFIPYQLQKFCSETAFGSAAGLVAVMELQHKDQAQTIKEELLALALEIESDPFIDEASYQATRDMKEAIIEMLDERLLNVPELETIQLVQGKPAFELSYELYGNIDEALNIIRFNKLMNPLYVPHSIDLKVKKAT